MNKDEELEVTLDRWSRGELKRTDHPAFTGVDRKNRAWTKFRLETFAPTTHPKLPVMYQGAIHGLRTDGTAFRIPIFIRKDRFDEVQTKEEVLKIVSGFIQQAIDQLDTYRECACKHAKPCSVHTGRVKKGE